MYEIWMDRKVKIIEGDLIDRNLVNKCACGLITTIAETLGINYTSPDAVKSVFDYCVDEYQKFPLSEERLLKIKNAFEKKENIEKPVDGQTGE